MKLFNMATLAVFAATAYGFCGNEVPDEVRAKVEAEFQKFRVQLPESNSSRPATYTIDIYWNAIEKGPSLAEGHIPGDQALAQIDVFNQAYAPILTFRLVKFQYVRNALWFTTASLYQDGYPVANQMKTALRQGGPATLNVYTVGFEQGQAASGLLGYGTFPFDYERYPQDDGLVLRFSALPGGATQGYNTGKIGVHELGHWFGLWHTFNEGSAANTCSGSSDAVDDTPAEASPAKGCPEGRDSCPSLPGFDPIHNHMDYSDDNCRVAFTQGQFQRVLTMIATFRGIQG